MLRQVVCKRNSKEQGPSSSSEWSLDLSFYSYCLLTFAFCLLGLQRPRDNNGVAGFVRNQQDTADKKIAGTLRRAVRWSDLIMILREWHMESALARLGCAYAIVAERQCRPSLCEGIVRQDRHSTSNTLLPMQFKNLRSTLVSHETCYG